LQQTKSLAVERTGQDEELVLKAMDSIFAYGRVVPNGLLRQSLAKRLHGAYETVMRVLVEKGLLEEVYAEGFDPGLRRIG